MYKDSYVLAAQKHHTWRAIWDLASVIYTPRVNYGGGICMGHT